MKFEEFCNKNLSNQILVYHALDSARRDYQFTRAFTHR